MAREMLNIRVDESLAGLVERAWQMSGASTKSSWVREALEAGARAEIDAHYRARQRRSEPGGGFSQIRPTVCSHPVTARGDTPTVEFCGLCRAVTRVKK